MRSALALLALVLLAPIARADDPTFVMTHEGRLLDGNDTPVDAPEQQITFRIFALSAATQGETSLWESGTCTVPVQHGMYSVSLGGDCGTNLKASVIPPDQTRFLEVQVGSTKLSPRLRIGSIATAAYAHSAGNADTVGHLAPSDLWLKSDQVDAATLGGKSPADITAANDLRYVVLGSTTTQAGGFTIDGIGTAQAFVGDGSGLTALNASRINDGTIGRAYLPADVPTTAGSNTFAASQAVSGTLSATHFAGEGSQITSLDASKLATGTVARARLPGDVPTTAASNTFAGDQTISGAVNATRFNGDGGGLTNLNAGAIAGTIPDAHLSTNIPNLTASGAQSFAGAISASTLTSRGDLTVTGRVLVKGANTPVGSIDLPVQAANSQPTKGSWSLLGPQGFQLSSYADYNEFVGPGQTLYARLCLAWTDGGDNSDSWTYRIRQDGNANNVAYTQVMGNTWSGAALYHTGCGAWVPASQFAICGTGWGGTCVMETTAATTSTHTSFVVTVLRGHLELAVK